WTTCTHHHSGNYGLLGPNTTSLQRPTVAGPPIRRPRGSALVRGVRPRECPRHSVLTRSPVAWALRLRSYPFRYVRWQGPEPAEYWRQLRLSSPRSASAPYP